MAIDLAQEKWSGQINVTKIGATSSEGGTRKKTICVGGQKSLAYLFKEGDIPYAPVIAQEIWDTEPDDWPDVLREPFKDVLSNPLLWAEKAVKEYEVDLICLKLQGASPEGKNKSPQDLASLAKKLLQKVDVPLIILGCGDDQKDNLVMPVVSNALKNERCLLGSAVQDNYKTLVASCLADGHNIIAESPIDINIAKQLNILITDMCLPAERIVINPTVGALGYGLEYAYSIMERARLASLNGDKMLSMPFVCFVGQEVWRVK
ncbi:MAG: acetyl-CoA decarbonylase/synthase complex subunit delta [Candidatus Omnitrophota bacterium]